MITDIEAILFDVGGTLRDSAPAPDAAKQDACARIQRRVGAEGTAEEFANLLTARFDAYIRWARATAQELVETDLWTQWLLPNLPADGIGPQALELTRLWREATGVRTIFPETKDVVLELYRRGYRLGIVSNTITSTEIPEVLHNLQIAGCFETVVLSCREGIRKPDPELLTRAVQRLGVAPGRCVYVGDRLNRDLKGAREAGFAAGVIRRAFDMEQQQREYPDLVPDHYVNDLHGLLTLFPARTDQEQTGARYGASLSTMWLRRNFPRMSDFLEGTRRLRVERVELNHQMDSSILDGNDLGRSRFSSVHEPCPADVSTDELKQRDWLVSATEESNRARGVAAIQRSIDLAQRWGLPLIVVHCGMVSADLTVETRLRSLFSAGQSDTPEFRRVAQDLIQARRALVQDRLAAVKRSLRELLDAARPYHIKLGLENRYHYFDIPSLDEMGELLALAPSDELGFVYDVGHAQAMDRLGFYPHDQWLKRYSDRIVEVHLHDVRGVNDHLAPGLGEVDFDEVARFLPETAIRTLELDPSNSPEQVRAGLEHLAARRCVTVL